MKQLIFSIAVFSAGIGLAGAANAQNWERVTSRDAFVAMLKGKTLVWGGNSARINADGSTTGKLEQGGRYKGNWVWDKGRYCRNLVFGKEPTGTFCAEVDAAGNQMRMRNQTQRANVTVMTIR